MKPIGGYFELELSNEPNYMHASCVHLNSGRHALEYILRTLDRLPSAIWLPYYTCEVVLQPINRLGIPTKYYNIDERFELVELPKVAEDELIIVNNYFGLKDKYVLELASYYKGKIIIDSAQAFYFPNHLAVKIFYSPRKFFGLPDGGLAWCHGEKELDLETDKSYNRCESLMMRLDGDVSSGYVEFRKIAAEISKSPLLRMSQLTQRMLSSINFESIRMSRKGNYAILREALQNQNQLSTPEIFEMECPMVYPFLTDDSTLRTRLIDNKIFVAQYWPNVLRDCPENSIEYKLAKYLIPLPIDQRYGIEEMQFIISIIKHEC